MADLPVIDIRPAGHTLEMFLASPARAKFIQGPVGSGKTTDVIDTLTFNAVKLQTPANGLMGFRKGVRYRKTLIIRNTYKQIVDTVIPSIRQKLPDEFWGPITLSGRPRRHTKLPGLDWELLFYATDKPEDVQDLKSLECSDAWVSEYRYIPYEIVSTLVERTGRFPPVGAGGCVDPQVMGETNAPMEDHWSSIMSGQVPMPEGLAAADKRKLTKPANWAFFLQPPGVLEVRDGDRVTGYVENPNAENLRNLRPGYYSDALGGKSETEIRTELMNKPGRSVAGKPVWPAFTENLHRAPQMLEPVRGLPIIVGQDFGRTPATVFCQHVAGRWLVLSEFWAENTGAAAYADMLKPVMATRYPGFNFTMFGDPAGEQQSQSDDNTPMLVFRAKGLNIIPAPTNDVAIRLNAVDQLFRRLEEGGAAISISPACPVLLSAVGGGYQYTRLQTSQERYSEQPAKNRHSHIADALQYAVVGGGEGTALLTRVGPGYGQPGMAGHNSGMRRAPAPQMTRGWGGMDSRRRR